MPKVVYVLYIDTCADAHFKLGSLCMCAGDVIEVLDDRDEWGYGRVLPDGEVCAGFIACSVVMYISWKCLLSYGP